ncbi:MAG: histidine--tRNA ligase [Desulfovibrionaceae bacterium]|nr:histidine--tRNA ligase [Desulfovibrionaceae bacterium]
MSDPIKRVKGFADMFEPESTAFTFLENTARRIFGLYGYTELRTPVLERTELFARGIGDETDVVQKEMYTFPDRGGRSLTMRPEATAGVMRAFIEAGAAASQSVSKFFTYGPMFRYEQPQKGRLRQFHQLNCECLGPVEPGADAEIITMLMHFLSEIGLEDLCVEINSLGDKNCRPLYRQQLLDWAAGLPEEELCPDCRRRMHTNPLRLLDCKVPACQALTKDAPVMIDHVCPDCRAHFDEVCALLDKNGVPWKLNPRMVRGLDYYMRTTFEVVSNKIGSQGAVTGGGRYDGLIHDLGGPDVPGIGFASGMERLAMLLPETILKRPDFYIAVVEDAAMDCAFELAQKLRLAGLRGEMSFSAKKMKQQMKTASKLNARKCLILGGLEVENRTVQIKDMDSGEQTEAALSDIARFFE